MRQTFALLANASNWAGLAVPCRFAATADGTPLSTIDVTAPNFPVPVGTTVVTVTATPKVALYWPTTITLTIAPGGSMAPDADSKGRVKLVAVGASDVSVAFANIQVSRFKDVTLDVLDVLKHPPTKRLNQPVTEAADNQSRYGTWPPLDWGLPPVPHVHFLDPANPVTAGAVNFAKDPSLKVEADSVVLKLAGVNTPQWFAVVWPKAIAPKADAAPTPIFLFIRQGAGQNVPAGYFSGGQLAAYPNNFDYANIGLFQNLHYSSFSPLILWGPKGVPYQVAKAGADVVTVIPCNSYGPEFGVLGKTEETGKILEELQAFMFWRAGVQVPPLSIGKTAIAAFSSGNRYLNKWLKDGTNRAGTFLSNTVSAVYFIDPPTSKINGFITTALTWAGGADRDKRIRLYSRVLTESHQKLLGKKPPAEPYALNSADNRRSASVVSLSSWEKAFKAAFGGNPSFNWQHAHHTVCATMLTHALAQGDF